MKLNKPNGNIISKCPVCKEAGILKFDIIVLKDKYFQYEKKIEDCPLCNAFGYIEVIEDKNEQRIGDNKEGDIYPR